MEWKTANLLELLETSPPGSFTRFSFSDVPSYLKQPDFERLLRAMIHAAAPGARFCIRQFLSDHAIPTDLLSSVQREPELERKLENEDRTFVYRFIVGTVRK